MAESYFNAGRNIKEHFNLGYDLSLQDIIRYPEVISVDSTDEEEDIWLYIETALAEASTNLVLMRKDEGLKSIYGIVGQTCHHFGWTFDYVFYKIDWRIVQRMLIDAPKYDSKTETDSDSEEIDLTEQSVEDIEKMLQKYK